MGDKDEQLISLMTRYSILAVVSVSGSTIVIICALVLTSFGDYSPFLYFVAETSQSTDVLIDALCICLSLVFYERHYQIICGDLHEHFCKPCFTAWVEKANVEKKLASVVVTETQQTPPQSADLESKCERAVPQVLRPPMLSVNTTSHSCTP